MSDEGTCSPYQKTAQRNIAVTLFRIVLWLLPAALAIVSAGAYAWLINLGYLNRSWWGIAIWLFLIIAFTLGTGCFSASLSRRSRLHPHGITRRIVAFVLVQLLITPIVYEIIKLVVNIIF